MNEWLNIEDWYFALNNPNPLGYVYFGSIGVYWMKYENHWLFHFCNRETYLSLN
jgi:hypothetical protein